MEGKMSKYLFNVSLCIIFIFMNLIAGEKPDFQGKWSFNEDKSTLDEMGRAFIPHTLVITQSENEMTIQKTFTTQSGEDMVTDEKMTLDGKESKSEIWNSPRITTAKWSENGDTLHIDIKITFNQDGNMNEMQLKEAWSMLDGGKCINVNHFSSSSWGERKITMVFDKQAIEQ